MKILVVDDREEMRYLLETLLKGSGYEVVTAVNGSEALAVLHAEKIDLIISDCLMPVMDGFELCRQCKADATLKNIPFVFCTASYPDKKDEEFGLALGAAEYIIKPFEPEDFIKTIKGVLERAKEGKFTKIKPALEDNALFQMYNERLMNKLAEKVAALYAENERCNLIEKELRISETNFRNSMDNSPLGIHIISEDGETSYTNHAFLDIYGYKDVAEFKNTPVKNRYTPESYAEFHERREKRLRGEPLPNEYEVSIVRKDGAVRQLQVLRKEILWGGEKQYQTIYQDITERRQAEQALLQNEEKYRTLFETMVQGVVYQDAEGYIFSVNPATERILGLTHDQVLGRTSTDPRWKAIHEDGSDFTGDMHPATVALRTGKEVRNVIMGVFNPGENKYAWININAIPQFKQGETKPHQVYTTFEDITERKQAEGDLKQSEERYRRLFEAARDGILILDTETGTVVDVNPFMVEMLGFSREQFLDKKIWELGFFKDIIASQDNFEELKRQKYISYENLPLETATGQRIQVEFVSHLYEVGNQKVIQCNIRDITERRRLEEERDKFTKELAEKNTELERFTYTVSHDLKSPLVTIKTFLGYLKQDITAANAGRIEKDMLFMNGAADKMEILLGELLEMSRIGRVVNPPVKITFGELVEEALRIVAGPITDRGVKVQVIDAGITLYGDRSRLVEIWQNLVENAVKFMGDQPSPQIDIGLEQHDSETVFFVRDNGMGIEPQYHSKLFNLFEKINPKTEGTGMGLAITKRIVELYQGRIRVESKGLEQGTCFRFTLPGALMDKDKGG